MSCTLGYRPGSYLRLAIAKHCDRIICLGQELSLSESESLPKHAKGSLKALSSSRLPVPPSSSASESLPKHANGSPLEASSLGCSLLTDGAGLFVTTSVLPQGSHSNSNVSRDSFLQIDTDPNRNGSGIEEALSSFRSSLCFEYCCVYKC